LVAALLLAAASAGCGNDSTTGGGANASNTATAQGVQQAPGNSEITTQQTGDTTVATRTFKDPGSPVERVVVTTQGGRRTARVYLRNGEVRELNTEGDIQRALDATADTLVSAGSKVVDATKAVGSEVGDKAEDVGDKAADVGREVGDKAEDVKDQTVKGAKAAGDKTKDVGAEVGDKAEDVGGKAASGAKKAGKAAASGVKKVIP
jgi:hypothetical protein